MAGRWRAWGAAAILAVGALGVGAWPVAAMAVRPPSGGTVAPQTCAMTIAISGALSSGSASVSATTPCKSPQTPKSGCQVTYAGSGFTPVATHYPEACASEFAPIKGHRVATGFTKGGIPDAWKTVYSHDALQRAVLAELTAIAAAHPPCNAQTLLVGGVQDLACNVSNMMHDLSSGNIVGTVISYAQGALALPFYSQGGLTGWIRPGRTNALAGIYAVTAALGIFVALIAGATRVVADIAGKRGSPGTVLVGAPIRIFVAVGVIAGFLGFASWLVPIFSSLATGLYEALLAGGAAGRLFASNGHMTAQAVAGMAGAGIAGLVGVVVALVLMLYLFVMFLVRSILLGFCICLAPIAIGLAVFDRRNEMFSLWEKMFVGALLMSVAGALGVGITFALFGAMLPPAPNGLSWLLAIATLIIGLVATTKLMTVAMRGAMSHRSPGALLTGMAGGAVGGMVAGGIISAGAGVTKFAGKVAGKGAGALGGAKLAAGAAAAGAGMAGVAGGARRFVRGTPSPQGAMAAAPVSTQHAMASLPPDAMDTALANDPQAQQVAHAATAHMPPTTSTKERLAAMSQSPHGRKTLGMLVEGGVGKAQLLGGAAPEQARFHYSNAEMGQMTEQANRASRAGAQQVVRRATTMAGVE